MANSGTTSHPGASTNGRHASFSDIKSDVVTLKKDLTDMAYGAASDGKAAVEQGYEKAAEHAQEMIQKGKEEVSKAHDTVAKYVSERPITAIAIAFGVGAIAARLMRR